MSRDPGTAVVLSGGGAKGAYEVGVLKALAAGLVPFTGAQPLSPQIFTGTSVGAYNATLLASDEDFSRAVTTLEKVWTERIAGSLQSCGNGVYRLRSGPLQLLQPGCALHPADALSNIAKDTSFWAGFGLRRMAETFLSDAPLGDRLADLVDFSAFFSASPLNDLIHSTVDLKALGRSSAELRFVATDWTRGRGIVFDSTSLEAEEGLKALSGSTALPGIFPPVPYRDTQLVDGGLVMNTPLKPALAAGAKELHVIYLDPFVAKIPLGRQGNSLETLYRTYTILMGTNVRQEFVTAQRINHEVQLLRSLSAKSASYSRQQRQDLGPLLRMALQRKKDGRPYREITVHRYRPDTDLGGGAGVLDFRAKNIRHLITTGYEDALAHDCAAEGCILPGTIRSEEDLKDGLTSLLAAP